MKIEIKDIKSTARTLKEMSFTTEIDKSTIFFPISTSCEKEFDGLTIAAKEMTSRTSLVPGLVVKDVPYDDGKVRTHVYLGYADSRFCPKFDPLQFLEMTGASVSKKLREMLTDRECYLVESEYLKALYKL